MVEFVTVTLNIISLVCCIPDGAIIFVASTVPEMTNATVSSPLSVQANFHDGTLIQILLTIWHCHSQPRHHNVSGTAAGRTLEL